MSLMEPDKIIMVPLDQLQPYENNPREHPVDQINQIANAMKEWGWTIPILVDEENRIIAGHGRYMAAKKLGMAEAPVIIAEGWDEAKKRGYTIADNQLTASSDWDKGKLSNELKSLQNAMFDLGLTGFSAGFIAQLTNVQAPNIGDNANPLLEKGEAMLEWRTKLIPMTSEEVVLLDKALKGYIHRTRSRSWFIDNVLKGTA